MIRIVLFACLLLAGADNDLWGPAVDHNLWRIERTMTPVASLATGRTAARTTDEKAQDQGYLAEHHWRLSPGSCGMLGCSLHGGGWIEEPGAALAEPTGCQNGGCCPPRFRRLFPWRR